MEKGWAYTEMAVRTAVEAGERIMAVYRQRDLGIRMKADRSPVTRADLDAHDLIMERLAAAGFPVLSEEGHAIPFEERKEWTAYWCVDPLDGTREFISGSGEFTVNIAFLRENRPVFGVIYAPVSRDLYFTLPGEGLRYLLVPDPGLGGDWYEQAASQPFTVGSSSSGRLRIVASKSHRNRETNTLIRLLKKEHPELELVSRGSSLKFCMMAAGEADLYPRLGRTMEWDTAAGQAVAEAAGCRVLRLSDHRPLEYNKPVLENPWFVVTPPLL